MSKLKHLPNSNISDTETIVESAVQSHLVKKALRFNTVVLAIVVGLGCAFGLVVMTYASLALTGNSAGHYLNLLGVFLPGYKVSLTGAWIGAGWTFAFAAISSAVVFRVYARAIGMNFTQSLWFDGSMPAPTQLVIMVAPKALGLSIGLTLALQLMLSTTWLVITGRADESFHAALLANYLPFYKVSYFGAIAGSIGIFLYGFVFAYLFASVYNTLVKKLGGVKS
jgi:hypothetical protein